MSTQAEAFQYRIRQLEMELVTMRDKWVRAITDEQNTRKKLEQAQGKLARIKAALR